MFLKSVGFPNLQNYKGNFINKFAARELKGIMEEL
jgi:hypothetical protein